MERIDDLQFNGLKLIQDDECFCFGTDSVELANFVVPGKNKPACDLGSGSGILSVLLAAKKGYKVTAVEVQERLAELCQKNVELNNLQQQITVVNQRMQDFCVNENKGKFDVVITNPPYQKLGSGDARVNESILIARSEILVTLDKVIECASHLTKFGGLFYIVHKTERLAEVITLCTQNLLQPKILQVLTPNSTKPPHLFLLSCIKNGKAGIKVLKERTVNMKV